MDKKTFFSDLEKKFSEKYNLTMDQVKTIRSAVLGSGMSRKDLAIAISIKLHQPAKSGHNKSNKNCRTHNLPHYQGLINFIASCPSEAWDDITKKTKFDK